MDIFLRCIFINCFLLVAIHSSIIAREGNENNSDNQSLIKKTTEIVDDTHHLLSEQISSVSDELDRLGTYLNSPQCSRHNLPSTRRLRSFPAP